MISGQKCSPEAELVAGKYGNPMFLTIMYKNEINTSFFNRYFRIAFTVRRILSHYSRNLRYLQFTICIDI